MESKMNFIAISQHRSEYPDPITFTAGTRLTLGDMYEEDEDWKNWYFCTLPNHPGGWVPEHIIERSIRPGVGIAKDDYTAKELDVNVGDEFKVIKRLNGWGWCRRQTDDDTGWVPMKILKEIR